MQEQGDFGGVLATREFQWTRVDGIVQFAFIDIGIPFLEPSLDADTDADWGCKVRSRGLGLNRTVIVYGVDAIQAVYLALVFAGNEVANSIVASSLDWKEAPNYGFPEPPQVPENNAAPGGKPDLQPLP